MIRQGPRKIGDEHLKLREISRQDAQSLYRWRTDPRSRTMFRDAARFSYADHLRFLERYFTPGNRDRWFIIEAQGRAVGTVALYDFSSSGHQCEWGRLIIDPAFRGQGLGLQAFELLLSYARQIGIRRIRSEVLESNHPSLRIHEKLGFSRHGAVSVRGRRFVQFTLELSP